VPALKDLSGTSLPGGGWRLDLEIEHGSKVVDGLELASEAVDAWRGLLEGWSLI
jgi:hypothetical protein